MKSYEEKQMERNEAAGRDRRQEIEQMCLERIGGKINKALHRFGYHEQEGDEGEEGGDLRH